VDKIDKGFLKLALMFEGIRSAGEKMMFEMPDTPKKQKKFKKNTQKRKK